MRNSRFSEEQITVFLKQPEAARPMGELCRRVGIPGTTRYMWLTASATSGRGNNAVDLRAKEPVFFRNELNLRKFLGRSKATSGHI